MNDPIELVRYYREHPEERLSMLREIGVNHPSTRYIEALEAYVKELQKDCKDYQQEIADTVGGW